jgi:ankyrin repeat protein
MILEILKPKSDKEISSYLLSLKKDELENMLCKLSSYGNNEFLIQYIVNKGVDVDCKTQTWSPLMQACYFNKFNNAKVLIEMGANVNFKDYHGRSPLMTYVINWNHFYMVEMLLKAGADLYSKDKKGNTPLDKAIYYNRYNVINEMINHDSSIINKIKAIQIEQQKY